MNELNTLLGLATAGALCFALIGTAVAAVAMLRDKTPLRPADFSLGIAAFRGAANPDLRVDGSTALITDSQEAANDPERRTVARAA